MYSFGKKPPRSIDSFGVSGILGEDARIYYESVFNTRHIGRVSDLLSIRLKKTAPDELRLRALLLLGLFGAYRTQLGKPKKKLFSFRRDLTTLENPVTIECGVDSEKIAVGILFFVSEDVPVRIDGIASRVSASTPESPFESLLMLMHGQSDRVLLRNHPETKRLEVVMLLGIEGQIEADFAGAKPPIEVIVFDKTKQVMGAPKPLEYIELGDLDYPKLLREENHEAKDLPPPATGDIIVSGQPERVRPDRTEVLKRAALLDTQNQKVKATDEDESDDVVRISGEGGDSLSSNEAIHVSGSGSTPSASRLRRKKVPFFKRTGQKIAQFIKSLWPFAEDEATSLDDVLGNDASQFAEESVENASSETSTSGSQSVPAPAMTDEELTNAAASSDELAAATVAKNLIDELQIGGFEDVIKKVQRQSVDLKKELASNPKSRRWVEGLLGELTSERGRLGELAKKLNISIRQKELAFKNKEIALTEELRRKTEELEKKESMLQRSRDALAHTTRAMDRLKTVSQSVADDAHYKQKYTLVQKMMAMVKEENGQFARKVEELRSQLSNAQMINKQKGPTVTEFQSIQAKYERVYRQAEEFKKVNRQLMELLNDPKRDRSNASSPGGPPSEDTRKRLEAAMKLATTNRREADQYKALYADLQKEEIRIRTQLNQMEQELKKAKGSGNGQAA